MDPLTLQCPERIRGEFRHFCSYSRTEVSVHPSWGQTTQVPRLAGRPQILYNLEDDDGNSNLDHLEFVPKIVWKISAERNKQPKARWFSFKYCLCSSQFGEDEPILTNIFQMGWNHHLETVKEAKVYIYIYISLCSTGAYMDCMSLYPLVYPFRRASWWDLLKSLCQA